MKKIELIILIVILNLKLIAQDYSNNFKVGDYLEIYNNDSVRIYYNCIGSIVDKKCASYIRIGQFDTTYCNLSGNFKDFYINGGIAFECSMFYNKLNGKATYYYENGQIKETGNYSDDIRKGVWTYFYENGKIEKILNFINGMPLVANYYTKRGKPKVLNGSGKYSGYFNTYKTCGSPYEISGMIENGKMSGKWSFYNPLNYGKVGDEYFENGLFIKGTSFQYEYKDNQKIFIQGYIANENVNIYENLFGCPGNSGIFMIEYKNSNINDKFYPEFIEYLKNFDNMKIQNQWILVGLTINENDSISKLSIYSSKKDESIKIKIKEIISKNGNNWKTGRIDKIKVCTNIIFTIIINNNEIIIPAKILHDEQIKWLKGER